MKIKPFAIIIFVVIACAAFLALNRRKESESTGRVVRPARNAIERSVSSTGFVQPQNRLEIIPPIAGRIDEILVREGDRVQRGQILLWMSSTDRAALLDAARAKGEEAVTYWQDVYKPTPLIAPIDGEVIVRAVEPGQTVSAATPVIVLSDRLIVRAEVDESDIGAVAIGQPAFVNLDAYPDNSVPGKVNHISYESKTVNNVTIYEVDIVLEEVPAFYRSGMSANVKIVQERKDTALLIPQDAIQNKGGNPFVLLKTKNGEPVPVPVVLGLKEDTMIEVTSGIDEDDTLVMPGKSPQKPKKRESSSPFVPQRRPRR